jgi:DNA-binding CsgD family transcriptional regulator/tetratricopeptide (TPR) repeat protein
MLVGRDRECARVERLLERARAGAAGALVVVGEAGIGKTALLDFAAERAEGMTVVRAVGVESEAQLEFSGLFDVCRPLLGRIEELPERQRDALAAALGIGPGASVDRFSLGAATLSLLAAAAEEAPVLVLLDDVQWLDAASVDALVFAARRLAAEPVAVLVAAREDDDGGFDRGGLETLALAGIDGEAAAALLAARAGREVAPEVAERVRRATGGSPLALAEVAGLLTPRQLLGLEPMTDPMPVGAVIERAFAERAARLPEHARRALLVAAVSSSAHVEPVVDALRRLGLDERSLELAEDAALVGVEGGRVSFRHPLVRSAVVLSAAASERRRAHRALADALAGRSQQERAWHLAAAALGPDEQAAAALAEAGLKARARSGWAAAARALERSARLTPDAGRGRLRLVEAAESAWVAGRIELTLALTDELLADGAAGAARAQVVRLRSRIELHCGAVPRALDHLIEAAALFAREDPGLAVALLADAVEAAELVGAPERALDAAGRAGALAPGDGEARFVAEFALGQALRLSARPADARAHLEPALVLLAASEELHASMHAFSRGARAAGWLDRLPEALALARRAIELAREQGAVGPLAHALAACAWLAARSGQWREAYAQASEGLELARETRCAWASTGCLEQLAWLDAAQGNEQRCRMHAAEALDVATRAGFRSDRARVALGLLALGSGHAQDAARIYETIDPAALQRADPGRGADLVEAHVRAGRGDQARSAYERTLAADRDAPAARCRGLLAADAAFEAPFREALELHAEHDPFGLARTRLCLGERLRRAGRRVDARAELRAAHDGLERLGARPWAKRAAAELRATGERLGRRQAQHGEQLTPQELQVALQAADGKTNKQIGAALFLSPKTVDFHLRRVYRKLDLNSRAELIKHFAAAAR